MTMKAAFIERFGPPDAIRYGAFPAPAVGARDVLVKVAAVAVNPIDTYIRSGAYQTPVPLPFVIGRDVTGVVAEVGSAGSAFRPGDRVWANNQGYGGRQGTFAEYCSIPEDLLYPLPGEADLLDTVAALHSGLTAVLGLRLKAGVAGGDTVFINGGSGNVGCAVLQFAKGAGASVIVTAAAGEKARWCRELGADLVIDYKTEDVNRAIRAFAPEGVSLYWDATPTPDIERALDVMAQRGRLVFMAGLKHRTTLPVGAFYTRNCALYGFTVTAATRDELRRCADEINAALSRGALRARIADRLPLSQAASAHRRMETDRPFGKLILLPDGGAVGPL